MFLLGTGELPPSELVGRPTRTLLASARSRTDLLLGHERELRRQQLRARIFGAVNAILAAACVVPVLLEEEPRLRLYALGCVTFFGAWAAYDRWHRLPRLRAALAEVGP